ncbi:MAG: AEC family transporter [Planctomycetota bacterium]
MVSASAYWTMFAATAPILLIAALSFAIVRIWTLGEHFVDAANALLINVALPAFILYQMLTTMSAASLPKWAAYPAVSLMFIAGQALVGAVFSLGRLTPSARMGLTAAVTFHNACFLPVAYLAVIPIAAALRDRLFNVVFLFVIPFGPLLSSLGVYLASGGKARRGRLSEIFNAPVVATLVGLTAALLHGEPFSPVGHGAPILRALEILAGAAIPLIAIVTGATLAHHVPRGGIRWAATARTVLATLIVVPAAAYFVGKAFDLGDVFRVVLVLEAAAPPALGLIVAARRFGGDEKMMGDILFVSYVASALTTPFWFALLSGALKLS